ncbi:MAG: hypothetical protein LBR26_11845 [Prevotella sp.]|nr:hypothetical protein [Prevotella sp.]
MRVEKRGSLWNAGTEHSTPLAVVQNFPSTQLNAESGEVSALSQSRPLSNDKERGSPDEFMHDTALSLTSETLLGSSLSSESKGSEVS